MSKGFICDICEEGKSGEPEITIRVGQDFGDMQHYDICLSCSRPFKRLLKREVSEDGTEKKD